MCARAPSYYSARHLRTVSRVTAAGQGQATITNNGGVAPGNAALIVFPDLRLSVPYALGLLRRFVYTFVATYVVVGIIVVAVTELAMQHASLDSLRGGWTVVNAFRPREALRSYGAGPLPARRVVPLPEVTDVGYMLLADAPVVHP